VASAAKDQGRAAREGLLCSRDGYEKYLADVSYDGERKP